MILVQETTASFEPNQRHQYMLSDDKFKMYGYKTERMSDFEMAKVPMQFNTRGRTFKTIGRVEE